MHPGMTLDAISSTIVEQNAQKRDLVAHTKALALVAPAAGSTIPRLAFTLNGAQSEATLTPLAVRQLGTWADIPAKYVDRLLQPDNAALLEQNVNHWLQASGDKRMVRTLVTPNGAIARAFLSDRYRPFDHYDLLMNVMPKIRAAGLTIKSAAVTDTRFYMQLVSEQLSALLTPGANPALRNLDVVHAGCVVSNSEVGCGAFAIEPMLYRFSCTNGMIAGTSLRRSHVGRGLNGGDDGDVAEYFSDETRRLDDAAFWAKVSDVLDGAFDEVRFRALVQRFDAAQGVSLPGNPAEIVEVTAQRFGLNKDESDAVMRHWFSDGDGPTLFGLTNAVTRTAQDATSYDRAIELERVGGEVLNLNADAFSVN